jgi:hypothetical protein
MCDSRGLSPSAHGACLLSSPCSPFPTLVTTHEGVGGGGRIVLWDVGTLSPTEFIDAPVTLHGILQSGGGSPNNNSRFSLLGARSDSSIGVLECFAPTSSAVLMSGGIGRGKRWCLAGGGDFLAAVVGGEGDFEEELQMTTLHRSVQGVKVEHDSKRRKVSVFLGVGRQQGGTILYVLPSIPPRR